MATILPIKPVRRDEPPEPVRPLWTRAPAKARYAPRLQPIIIARPETRDLQAQPPIWFGPRMVDIGRRYAGAIGFYRIFNDAVYRLYRNNTRPPVIGDTPYATSASLPTTPVDTFADGTWYLSVSYFNGVLESGFLPLGPRGESYVRLVIASGVAAAQPPSVPFGAYLQVRAGGVVRVVAFYAPVGDGANAADHWGIAYTTNGSTPASGAASITQAIPRSGLAILAYDLPAQAEGTTVKVQLQTMRGTGGSAVYSDPGTVLTATATSKGPKVPQDLKGWPGIVPGGA